MRTVLQYYATALALKTFSSSRPAQALYRTLGNAKNAFRPERDIAWKYYFRSPTFLDVLRQADVLRPGLKALEIGTGFVHWEALMLRNEVPCSVQLYDVWDNRTLHRFQSYARCLARPETRRRLGLSDDVDAALMAEVAGMDSFEEIYARLGFDYRPDPTGLLAGVPDTAFDLVVSSDVGEHMQRSDIPAIIARSMQVLKPGGWAFHQVCLADHLFIYAKGSHPKQYLKYSKAHFAQYLNNGVQYINQVQVPEWRGMFESAGFEIVRLDRTGTSDLSEIDIHPDWAGIPQDDLACTVAVFLLRKPGPAV
jgi:hypothetical protein